MYFATSRWLRHRLSGSRGHIRQSCSGGLPEATDEAGTLQTARWGCPRIRRKSVQRRPNRKVGLQFKDECLAGSEQERSDSTQRNNRPLVGRGGTSDESS